MKRFKVAGAHLLLNVLIFIILLALTLFFWFPSPYFTASGGLQGMKLIVLVDIVLGPLLTFTVVSNTKPANVLRKDLMVIGALQITALIWGIYTIYNQRPVAAVFWEDSFYTVTYSAYKHNEHTPLPVKNKDRSIPLLFAQQTKTGESLKNMIDWIGRTGVAPYADVKLQQPYRKYFEKIKVASINIDEVIERNTDMKSQLVEIINKTGFKQEGLRYIPLKSKYRNILIVFDGDGNPVGYLQAPFKKGV